MKYLEKNYQRRIVMPKMKTSSSIVKRFKITAKGKILRHKAGKSHLLSKKTSNRKKNLSHIASVKKQDIKLIRMRLKE